MVYHMFAAALLCRLLLSRSLDPAWTLSVDGLLGDATAAVFITTLIALALLVHRALAFALLVVWLLLTIANAEHIYALDAPLRLGNFQLALDETFIRGSLGGFITWPMAFVALFFALLSGLILRRLSTPGRLETAVLLAAALASGTAAWQHSLHERNWRQASPLVLMLVQQKFIANSPANASGLTDTDKFFRNEVKDGRRQAINPDSAQQPNVLIVVLEGLPGIYLRQTQQATGVPTPIEMPKLSAIAARGRVVPQFLAQTHGTIQGLYNLFCGDYAILTSGAYTNKTSLMLSLANDKRPVCLPSLLAATGYQTAYIQAAEIKYMQKNEVLPLMGFADVSGHEAATVEAANFWGEDDGSLLTRALAKIDLLEAAGQPWFLSILTVGTHHPFLAPTAYRQQYGDAKLAAVRYLDDQIADFMITLDARNLPENTLILFTSDESHGVPGHPLGSSWSLAVAIGPGITPSLAKGTFGQIDLAVSVLDYLDLGDNGRHLLGRSFMRDYPADRALLFENHVLTGNQVINCVRDSCRRYQLNDGKLFASTYTIGSLTDAAGELEAFQAAFTRANSIYGRGTYAQVYLARNISWHGVERNSLGGQFTAPNNSRLEVILEIANTNRETVATPLLLMLDQQRPGQRLSDGLPHLQLPPLPPDSRLSLHYVFSNSEHRTVNLALLAVGRGQKQINVQIDRLEILSSATNITAQSFRLYGFELTYPTATAPQRASANLLDLDLAPISGTDQTSVAASRTANGDFFIAPRYTLGDRIDFSDPSDWTALFYLAGGWSYPDDWGVWSDGNRPAIAFKAATIAADRDHEIALEILPHISPPIFSERNIQLLVNGQEIATKLFTAQEPTMWRLRIPAGILQANELNTLTLVVAKPFQPSLYNAGNDFTRLGLGLLSFQISSL